MKKSQSQLLCIFGVLLAVVAVVATFAAVLIHFDKKKDEEELERYLDCSIQ